MRRLITGIGLLMLMMGAAACGAGGAEPAAEPAAEPDATPGVEPTRGALATVVSQESSGGPTAAATAAGEAAYPAGTPTTASAYPVATAAPSGYPDVTVVAPSGTVELSDVTPVAGAEAPQEMPMPGVPLSGDMQKLVDSIYADLSAVSGVTGEEMKLVSAEPTTWPDGSLGCPAPDMMYTQALVDGYLITVEAGGQTYEYHTAGLRSWVRCESGRPASAGAVGG